MANIGLKVLSDAINFSIGGFQHILFPSCIYTKINGCISEMSSASGPRDKERYQLAPHEFLYLCNNNFTIIINAMCNFIAHFQSHIGLY